MLGNGYRAFNPVLMRFNSPDSWSPFGEGGLNAYVYCIGDPVNRDDPTGHWGSKSLGNWLHRRSLRIPRTPSTHTEAPRQAGLPPQLHQKIWILKGDYLRTVRWPIRTHANLLNSKVRHHSAAIGLRLISNNLRLFLIQRLHPSYRYAYDWRVN